MKQPLYYAGQLFVRDELDWLMRIEEVRVNDNGSFQYIVSEKDENGQWEYKCSEYDESTIPMIFSQVN